MSVTAAPTFTGRFAPAGVLASTVLVFAGVVAAVTLQLRTGLREQLLQREAAMLAAVASMHLDNRAAELAGVPLEDAPAALLAGVLKTSKLNGVSGVRIFTPDRHHGGAWPFQWSDEPPPAAVWSRVAGGDAIGQLHPGRSSEAMIGLAEPATTEAAVEAWVPLRLSTSENLLGAAQFILNGSVLAADLRAHDRRLWTQAAMAWLIGSAVIVLTLGWALRRLEKTNVELRTRSEDLQRANRELVLAAKTSALGAVTAHLMHEIKNPLAGLEVIVGGHGEPGARLESGRELAAASELTRRLRTMVNDVVGVLRDEQSGAEFELTPVDVAEIVAAKVRGEAEERGVALHVQATGERALAGRRGNLASLVLRNLLQNAIDATPREGVVRLVARAAGDGTVEFLVEDGGAGLPIQVRARLFQPCASTKAGGSGLGLALSYQLAQQAGGRLELVRSDENGSSFRLVLPPEA